MPATSAGSGPDALINTEPQPLCPACGGDGPVAFEGARDYFFGAPGDWRLRRCDQCASLWLDPVPRAQELAKAYRNYHTHLAPSAEPRRSTWRRLREKWLELVLRQRSDMRALLAERPMRRLMYLHDRPVGRLLDIGCGGGRFLRRMKKQGWQVEGIDFDPLATARVTRKYGIATHVGDVRDVALASSSFDAIVMSHAIEHVIDPVSLLRRCHTLLKPDGVLSIVTPNARSAACRHFGRYWRGLEVPRHIQVFSPQGLHHCLRRAGFKISACETFSFDAEGVYAASATMRTHILGISPKSPANRERIAKLSMLAEFRLSRRRPHLAEDIRAMASPDPAFSAAPPSQGLVDSKPA